MLTKIKPCLSLASHGHLICIYTIIQLVWDTSGVRISGSYGIYRSYAIKPADQAGKPLFMSHYERQDRNPSHQSAKDR